MSVEEIWQRGVAALEQGDPRSAEEAFEKACRLDSEAQPSYVSEDASPLIWCKRGVALLRQDDLYQSRECLLAAAEGDPSLFEAWLNLGIVALKMDKPAEALEHLARAVRVSPQDPRALRWQANAHLLLGQNQEALKVAEACLEKEPDSLFALAMRAQSLEKLGQFSEAAEDYRTALRAAPENFQFQALLLRTLEQAMAETTYPPRRVIEFCCEYRALLPERDGRQGACFLHQGRAHQALGETEQALACLKEAVERSEPGADWSLARLHWSEGRVRESLVLLSVPQQLRFVREMLTEIDPERVKGWPKSRSRDQLRDLLRGQLEMMLHPGDSKGCQVKLRLELGGGHRLSALALWCARQIEFQALFEEQYRAPGWPPSVSLDEETPWQGSLRLQHLPWESASLWPGASQAPELPGPEAAWQCVARNLAALQILEEEDLAWSREPLEIPEEVARARVVLLEPRGASMLADLVAFWLAHEGAEFALRAAMKLDNKNVWRPLRRYLAGLDKNDYEAAFQAAAELREGTARSFGLTYCFPNCREWVNSDLESWLQQASGDASGWKLLSCLQEPGWAARLLRRKRVEDCPREAFSDLVLGMGCRAAQPLLRLFDAAGTPEHQLACAESLALIDSRPVHEFFRYHLEHAKIGELAHAYLNDLDIDDAEPKGRAAVPEYRFEDPAVASAVAASLRRAGCCLPDQDPTCFTQDQLDTVEELEISELSLRAAGCTSVTSLSGLEHCRSLESLRIRSCQPTSLLPLTGLTNLRVLVLGPPEPEDLEVWQLVELQGLERLKSLRQVSLPVDERRHPGFQRVLKRLAARSELANSGEKESQGLTLDQVPTERRDGAWGLLREAMEKAYEPFLALHGLRPQEQETIYHKLSAIAVFFLNPEEASRQVSVLAEPVARELAQLEERIEDGLELQRDAWQSAEEWICEGQDEEVAAFLADNLQSVSNYYCRRLLGQPCKPREVNWFIRKVEFENALQKLGHFEPQPVLDLHHGRLSWYRGGRYRATCAVLLLGVRYSNGSFLAGWCDPVVTHVASACLGVPGQCRAEPRYAWELACAVAGESDVAAVFEVQQPDGTLYLGVSKPWALEEDARQEECEPPAVDQELYERLKRLLSRPVEEEPGLRESVVALSEELRVRARLYWHGTRAGRYSGGIAADLKSALDQADDDTLREALKDVAQRWGRVF